MNAHSNSNTLQMHQMNRSAWNEAAEMYEAAVDVSIEFLRSGGKNFCNPELAYLKDLADWCERAIHLQCAGGRDTLSLWNHGAREVIGIDISDRMIAAAQRTSQAIDANAQWFCCDILEAPHELDGTADLVYTGRGALCWIMDINAWANVIERLLKPEGRLYIFDGHPLQWLWDVEASTLQIDPKPPYGNYFSREIDQSRGWPGSYIPPESVLPVDQQSVKHECQWTLGDIINSLIDAGLFVVRFEEHPDQYWDQFPNLPLDVICRLPQTFSLLMRKPF